MDEEKRFVSTLWLATVLRGDQQLSIDHSVKLSVIDLRHPNDFQRRHIAGSVNLVLPTLLHKRLQRGTVAASSLLMDAVHSGDTVVLVDGGDSSISSLIYKRLQEENCHVFILQDSVGQFLTEYPEFCVDASSEKLASRSASDFFINCSSKVSVCVLTEMQALRLADVEAGVGDSEVNRLNSTAATTTTTTATATTSSSSSSSTRKLNRGPLRAQTISLVMPNSNGNGSDVIAKLEPSGPDYKVDSCSLFPVEIIPYLYLGNAANASDISVLQKYNINYVVNVTRNLPNAFESDARFKYLQIPIDDNWSQNLASHFPKAIQFINEARSKKCGVLVHCLAGISRSVTVTVAYLMQTLSLSLDDAYDMVKRHKPNISPNFDFLGQLVEFERRMVESRASKAQSDEDHSQLGGAFCHTAALVVETS
ncbi:Dual specificity protein phosphatase [Trichinella pseudospiralis]|uniref:Dual specificity protein phosphatase n=1 Tax=Trichinella pseudospiralis TaxID=6337 RepID=A0A0V1J0Q7_TRIPS|nr:Dual specificity protein phosphatase [Trichinella pseudospiralis]KRZ28550.1 Dual specificity protein phosphatase [Trichinella pseudospiralis]KRZ35328.1 Dual specificity protein phosphatase [Trichinella pseudospiralis]